MAQRSHVNGRSTVERPFRLYGEEHSAAIPIKKFDPGADLAMPKRPAVAGGRLVAGLLVTAAGLALSDEASAQASCGLQGSVYTCTVLAGSTPTNIDITLPDADGMPQYPNQSMAVTILGDTNITSSSNLGPWGLSALGFAATGVNTYGLTISNQGTVTLAQDSTTEIGNFAFGIYALQTAVLGSSQTGVTLTNSGAIEMNLSGVQATGGAAIWASDRGGASGGASVGTAITNSGAITAALTGQYGFAGIQSISYGGYDGFTGSGGAASIVNSAPVDITWTWQNVGSGNGGVYGLQAQSQGSAGYNNDDGDGGDGGQGGSAAVTLTEGGDVTVAVSGTPPSSGANSAGVLGEVIGGDGGAGAGGKH